MKCCRCLTELTMDKALGGKYGGVVCIYHRSCQSCWWDVTPCGFRKKEPIETKSIPLVDHPRWNKDPKCFGCLYKMDKIGEFSGSGTADDPIIID